MVTTLFQKHIVRKNISKGVVTFKIYIHSQAVKKRKSADVVKRRTELSMVQINYFLSFKEIFTSLADFFYL